MSSGFVTENEIAEARKRRQEEWEKVRKPEDPMERPEDPYDARSLYERLQEQKQKKDLEYEEAHKLKNMIKGLDDDEIEFLDLIDRSKLAADRRKELEEELELNDYRNRVATLQEQTLDQRLQSEKTTNKSKLINNINKFSQQQLLKGIVVKKRKNSEDDGCKISENSNKKFHSNELNNGHDVTVSSTLTTSSSLKCIGILPGLGCYSESTSDEENSSDESEIELNTSKVDILGRQIIQSGKAP